MSYSADSSDGARVIAIDETRGMIYDRNMIPLVGNVIKKMLFVNPSDESIEYIAENSSAGVRDEIFLYSGREKPFLFSCDSYSGSHYDITEIITYDRYSSDDIAVHLTGYTDSSGNGVSGIEKGCNDLLGKFSGTLSLRYKAAASGRILAGFGTDIVSENYASSGGVVLTIDSTIQRVCENAMKNNNLNKGAVVVLDVESGGILALASTPVFDRTQLSESLDDDNQPFVNRALSAYPVGSVFKPVVAFAALTAGIGADTSFECKGSVTVSGVVFNCHERNGHGVLNMADAMAVSCNCYFIMLGQQVGADAVTAAAGLLGLGNEIKLCDGLVSSAGNLPSLSEIDSAPSLANLSFGQGELLATPLQIAAVYRTFAALGDYAEPYIFESVVDENRSKIAIYNNETHKNIADKEICRVLCAMLEKTVSEGSGVNASPMWTTAAGKTATAETGRVTENGKQVHTWFAGYFPAVNPEYVVVVFREDGSSSASDCAPVFRDIADALGR